MRPLPGTAKKGIWNFYSKTGTRQEKTDAIFPLFTINNGTYRLIGTGFYITENGLFMTARHVIMDICNDLGETNNHLYILHLHINNSYTLRPVLSTWNSNEADISVGVAAPMSNKQNKKNLVNAYLSLTDKIPPLNCHVVTYAFPSSILTCQDDIQRIYLKPDFYDGVVKEYHKKVLGGPAYETNMHIHGGASGGPVIDYRNGRVFGVNSNSFTPPHTNTSFVAPILPALKAEIEKVSIQGKTGPVKISDLIKLGYINCQ
jgi:hypothetical protein